MGVTYFIVAERPIEGLDMFVDGKALAHCRPFGSKDRVGKKAGQHLEKLARDACVQPFLEFFSVSREDALGLIESEEEFDEIDLPPEKWFSAADGLATVLGLTDYLKANPEAADDTARLIEDLRQFAEVLSRLDQDGVRWHLAIDT